MIKTQSEARLGKEQRDDARNRRLGLVRRNRAAARRRRQRCDRVAVVIVVHLRARWRRPGDRGGAA